jgi:transcriptional regulator with XRE-family HTH domain
MSTTHPGPAARALAEYLHAEQLTQKQLADRLGVTEGAVSHLVAGRRRPSRELAVAIETLTGIPVAAWSADV